MKLQFQSIAMLIVGMAWSATGGAASLYQPENYQALTSDYRSFRQGDALTVLIVEASSAQSSANSTAARETSVGIGASDTVHESRLGLDLSTQRDGAGATARSGKLQAQMSVRVQDVAANGDLVVFGSQKITVNGETQMISVSGTVRPIDVTSDNVVLSTRLTNADIVYSGRGFVDRNQEESWVSRLLGMIGL